MILTQNQKLYIAQIFRVILTLFILYGLNISFFYKIILIMLSDLLDRDIPNIFFSNWISGTSNTYQRIDKITDSICYLILLIFLINCNFISIGWKIILITLFLFRTLGVSLFLKNNDRKYLFYFPNFFLEITLAISAINEFSGLHKYTNLILVCVVIYKIFTEYIHHYMRN
jgi:hypothetical protein